MNFLHTRHFVSNNQGIKVTCTHQCNVLLLDDSNFNNYKTGRQFSYNAGGFYTNFPALLQPYSTGYWNIVLDLAGGQATIQHNIEIINL